jgi:hypothetical protein
MQQWSFQSVKNSEEREQRLLLLLMVWTVLGAHLGPETQGIQLLAC